MKTVDWRTWLAVAVIGLLRCSHYVAQETYSEQYLRRYLDAKEVVFEDICVQMGTAYWNAYSQEAPSDLETPKQRCRELLSNDTLNMLVSKWCERSTMIRDSVLMRRVRVWRNILTAARVEMDDEVFDLRNQLELWLTETSGASERPSQEELDKMMLQLMKLRNTKAQECGFGNFSEMVLEVTEIGADWFHSFVETIDSATAGPYKQLLRTIRQEKNKEEIEYKDIRQLFGVYYVNSQGAQIPEEKMSVLMEKAIENIGIDFDALNLHLVEQNLPGGVGGQSVAIRIPTNFRIVVRDELSLYDRMHELGHGLHCTFTITKYPVLKGYEWCIGNDCGAYSEGIAETIAKFVCNGAWQREYTDLSGEDLATQEDIVTAYLPVYLRFLLARSMIEIELYKDPEQNYLELWERVHKKYLFLDKPIGRSEPFTNIIYVSYPIYVQNYLIAEIMSWQIHRVLQDRYGANYVFDKKVGEYLKDGFCAEGEFYPWKTRLKRATGKELDVDGYLSSIVSRSGR